MFLKTKLLSAISGVIILCASCGSRSLNAKNSLPNVPFPIDNRVFFADGSGMVNNTSVLIQMPRSTAAVHMLTRVMVRYILTDRNGQEHTRQQKHSNPYNYPSYVSRVFEFEDDFYFLDVDTEILPTHRVTLLKILVEEIVSSGLPVEGITIPGTEENVEMKVVGPSAMEVFGDVAYDGWVPSDLVK